MAAAGQMTEAGDTERIGMTEMGLLVAVGEMGVEHRAPRGMSAIERENVCGIDVSGVEEGCDPCGRAVLIWGQGHTIEEGNSAPKDERVMSKIKQREDYSQYFISPS